MDIKIYKTATCPACKTLIGMIPPGVHYKIINADKINAKLLPKLNGAPTVYIDGEMLDNAFELLDRIKDETKAV